MSKLSDAAFTLMKKRKVAEISSADLWAGLLQAEPAITAVTPTRKTPRTTAMRDVRKDPRFVVVGGKIALRG